MNLIFVLLSWAMRPPLRVTVPAPQEPLPPLIKQTRRLLTRMAVSLPSLSTRRKASQPMSPMSVRTIVGNRKIPSKTMTVRTIVQLT